MSLRTERTEKLKYTNLTALLLPTSLFVVLNAVFIVIVSRPLSLQFPATKASPIVNSGVVIAQAEARQIVNVMTRSQQAYYLKHGKFSTALSDLNLDVQPDTSLYFYRTFTYRDQQGLVMVAAVPRHQGFKTYVGFVNVLRTTGIRSTTTEATLCESREAKPLLRRLPKTVPNSGIVPCPSGFVSTPMI
jgi:hypothetical protein